MAKGIITLRNTGGGGGISSVPARIICDTSNLQTTDAVRVQSMTNPTSVETVDVVTPGEFLIFDVDGRDYYKISLVQEIDNEDVEMVSVYRTLGFGEATVVNVFDKTHLSGIQAILNSHSESTLLNLGDEVIVNIGGTDEIYKIAGLNIYGTHEAIFVAKYASTEVMWNLDYMDGPVKNWLDGLYNGMTDQDKALLKERRVQYVNSTIKYVYQKIWAVSRQEVFGGFSTESESIQFPYFYNGINRIYRVKSGAETWWGLRDAQTVMASRLDAVSASGSLSYVNQQNVSWISSFHLVADI